MPTTYIEHAQQGETIDALMHRAGCTRSLEDVLTANPQLYGSPVVLEYNTPVYLPYNDTATRPDTVRDTIQLWS